jgi:hypothetical protein
LFNSIEHCLGQTNKYLVHPTNSIASLYGIVKCYIQNTSLRSISTGYSSITAGAEAYTKEFIEPLLKKCTFLDHSQKTFKKRFQVEIAKFDENLHQVVSFDITQMYPSVNITRVVRYILPLFLKTQDSNSPPKKILRVTPYLSQLGPKKQLKGIQMSSKLAPVISNLFIGC